MIFLLFSNIINFFQKDSESVFMGSNNNTLSIHLPSICADGKPFFKRCAFILVICSLSYMAMFYFGVIGVQEEVSSSICYTHSYELSLGSS